MCDSFDMVRTQQLTFILEMLFTSLPRITCIFFFPGTPRAFNLTQWDLMMSAFLINIQRYSCNLEFTRCSSSMCGTNLRSRRAGLMCNVLSRG